MALPSSVVAAGDVGGPAIITAHPRPGKMVLTLTSMYAGLAACDRSADIAGASGVIVNFVQDSLCCARKRSVRNREPHRKRRESPHRRTDNRIAEHTPHHTDLHAGMKFVLRTAPAVWPKSVKNTTKAREGMPGFHGYRNSELH